MSEFYLAAEPAPVLLGPHVNAVSYFTDPLPADDPWSWGGVLSDALDSPVFGVNPFIAYYDRRTGRLLGTASTALP